MCSPLMWAPSSDASIAITPATTSGPFGPVSDLQRSIQLKSAPVGMRAPFDMGVAISPGHTEFARRPWRAYSTASVRVIASTAPLEAEYAPPHGSPDSEEVDAALTMLPPVLSRC